MASKSGLSAADRNKRVRQEALRDQLSNQKLVEKVVDIAQKLGDLDQVIEADKVARLKIAAELNLKLVNKYLPDLKQTELVGDPDKPVEHRHSIWNLVGVKPSGN